MVIVYHRKTSEKKPRPFSKKTPDPPAGPALLDFDGKLLAFFYIFALSNALRIKKTLPGPEYLQNLQPGCLIVSPAFFWVSSTQALLPINDTIAGTQKTGRRQHIKRAAEWRSTTWVERFARQTPAQPSARRCRGTRVAKSIRESVGCQGTDVGVVRSHV